MLCYGKLSYTEFIDKHGWVKLAWFFLELCFYFEFYKEISVKIKPYFLKYPFARRTKLVKSKKRTSGLITYAGEQNSVSGQRQ